MTDCFLGVLSVAEIHLFTKIKRHAHIVGFDPRASFGLPGQIQYPAGKSGECSMFATKNDPGASIKVELKCLAFFPFIILPHSVSHLARDQSKRRPASLLALQ